MDKLIYMDNAATTRVTKEVSWAMKPYFMEEFGNPASLYEFAKYSSNAIDHSREIIKKFINAKSGDIYFTSGGSESDNWALKGIADSYANKGKHIITSKIEHHAILNTCKYLEEHGYNITYVDVDEYGIVKVDEIEKAIRPDTILISIMAANNEIGTIQPIKEIGKIAHENGIIFHTDAVQAYGHIPLDVEDMHIDMMSVSGHKINAPKGVGFLYIRDGINIYPLIHGGSQENGLRAGTSNVPSIVGLGKATYIASETMKDKASKLMVLRAKLTSALLQIPNTRLNGHFTKRLPNNVNVSFDGIEGETLSILLGAYGICVSSGSACNSGSMTPSHVLKAIGLSDEQAIGALRLTLSEDNTTSDIDYVVKQIQSNVETLRMLKGL